MPEKLSAGQLCMQWSFTFASKDQIPMCHEVTNKESRMHCVFPYSTSIVVVSVRLQIVQSNTISLINTINIETATFMNTCKRSACKCLINVHVVASGLALCHCCQSVVSSASILGSMNMAVREWSNRHNLILGGIAFRLHGHVCSSSISFNIRSLLMRGFY